MSFQLAQLPFNIDLLTLTASEIKSMRPIKVLDIFSSNTKNFHPDGLFSIDIFGKVGEERRNRLFAYIDLRIEIFHPLIYDAICDLKGLYGDILAGREYAIFDTKTKDFIKTSVLDGETGYAFFCRHFQELQFEDRPSPKREFNIRLVNLYRDNAFVKNFVVMPAGLRDYEYDENGKPSEDDINKLYRKILSIASVIDNVNAKQNEEYLDTARYNLQQATEEVYNYVKNMLEGKNKFIQSKWTARKIFNSTRNVITSYLHDSPELLGDKSVSTNQSVVGLYQFLRGIFPLAVKQVRDTYLSDVFTGPNSPAMLVNKKTLKKETVHLGAEYYDEWMTVEGLEKVFARFGQDDLRHDVLETDTHYFGLLYKGPDMTYRWVQDIDELPEGRDAKDLHPITFAELLYLSVYKGSSTVPALITRYPITGYGSIYPSYTYLRTTIKSEVRVELNDQWERGADKASEFPVSGDQFFSSLSVSSAHLQRLTADHDGDVLSYTCALTEEARAEIRAKLNSRDYYVGIDSRMFFSASTDIIDLVLASMCE